MTASRLRATWAQQLTSPTARSVAWQFMGSAATLCAALWVAWRLGLEAQGEFGLAKSWFDAGAALASLGLPQGLLHLQYRRQVAAVALRSWLLRFLLALGAASAVSALGLLAGGLRLAAAVAASLPFAVGHLLARSLLLAQHGPAPFGFATALPPMLVLAGVLGIGLIQRAGGFDALLLAAAAVAACISLGMAWPRASVATPQSWSRRELWQVSLQSWTQAGLAALLAAALLSIVAASGQGATALGRASLGLQLYQVFVVLAGYASPLLFDRIARQNAPALPRPPWWPGRRFGVALFGLLLVGGALLAACVDDAQAMWALPLALMLPGGVAAVAARMTSTVLLARGEYAELSLQALWRLALAAGLLALALRQLPAAAAVAVALLLTEAATWWRCWRCLRRPG